MDFNGPQPFQGPNDSFSAAQGRAQTFWGACAETEKGHPPDFSIKII